MMSAMTLFSQHPVLRWAVPSVAAVAVVGATIGSGAITASAGGNLPDRSAAQLLVDVHNARIDAISGTVVQRADLGLPDVSALTGASGSSGSSDFSSMVAGTHTVRLWYSGPDKTRIALMGSLGESDIVRSGADLWTWSSKNNTATHTTLPAGASAADNKHPMKTPADVPMTPQQAADQALAAVGKTTVVSTNGTAKVAGRSAYELVLAPKDTASLVGQVRVAIDGARHVPLRVQVFAKGATSAAFEVAFTQVDFTRPDAAQFTFSPPPGAKVTQEKALTNAAPSAKDKAAMQKKAAAAKASADQPTVVGSGWTSIVVAKVPATAAGAAAGTSKTPNSTTPNKGFKSKAPSTTSGDQLSSMLALLPKVSGSWGSGHLLAGKLFSVLLTDDNRLIAGAVTPQALYAAAAK